VHEAAITRSLLERALAVARGQGAGRIRSIRLLVGESGGVVPECVQHYFDQLRTGTAAEQAVLEFRRAALRIRCPKCRAEFGSVEQMCGCNAGGEVVAGQDLVLESIEVD
jgi:hydrogenase nickel incorporation protein HypA/HybF